MKTKKLTTMAILTALAMALSWLEGLIPLELVIPLPGVKLGLANTVTLFALYTMDLPAALLILVARCLLGALFSGNITALAFSLTGGVLSMLTMAIARRSRHLSVYGVSVLGAAAHNIGQILIATLLMHSVYIAAYLPYLLLIGTACGCATATVAAGVLRALAPGGKGIIPEMRADTDGPAQEKTRADVMTGPEMRADKDGPMQEKTREDLTAGPEKEKTREDLTAGPAQEKTREDLMAGPEKEKTV